MRLVLVTKNGRRLKRLVVVDAEHSARQRCALRDQAANLRWKVPGAGMAEGPVGLEAVEIRGADTASDAIELGVVPGDRERDGGVEQRAVVVGAMRVLPEIIRIQ